MVVEESLLPPPFPGRQHGLVPSDAQCLEWMHAAGMEAHIRAHSSLVAVVAETIAGLAIEKGFDVDVQAVRAAALLHDIAKPHTIAYGGNHCQIGGAWVQHRTGNPAIAQGVIHHVCWPGPIDVRAHTLVLAVIYGDKRVRHETIVSLEERFQDLLERYGTTKDRKTLIQRAFDQTRAIEQAFNRALEVNLNAYPFDCGRMVE